MMRTGHRLHTIVLGLWVDLEVSNDKIKQIGVSQQAYCEYHSFL